MLYSSARLMNCPVISLHVSGQVARVSGVIVDPHDLKIAGFHIVGPTIGHGEIGTILEVRDIREFSQQLGMIIDSTDVLVNSGDVIKLDKIMDINYQLVGKKVVTKKGSKLGKVMDYVIDPESFMIAQIIVKRPAMKAFLDPELIIGRSEIKEVDDNKIVIKDEMSKLKQSDPAKDFVPNFVNPFRGQTEGQSTSPAHTKNLDELDTE